MKTISAGLATHLASEVSTLATCWKITLGGSPAEIKTFTDHDEDFVFDGLTYAAATGYSASAVETRSELNVDNLEVVGILQAPSIIESDLTAGRWDYALVEIFKVNWNDLTQGALSQREGRLGEVTLKRGKFVGEIRGLAQALQKNVGQLYSPLCRAILGDTKCAQVLTDYTASALVVAASSARQFTSDLPTKTVRLTPSTTGAPPANYFQGGKLTWTSGANSGLVMEIKTYAVSGGEIVLQLPMPYAIAAGDAFSAVTGCDHKHTTCRDKFGNIVNFRGEPYLPGGDAILEIGSR